MNNFKDFMKLDNDIVSEVILFDKNEPFSTEESMSDEEVEIIAKTITYNFPTKESPNSINPAATVDFLSEKLLEAIIFYIVDFGGPRFCDISFCLQHLDNYIRDFSKFSSRKSYTWIIESLTYHSQKESFETLKNLNDDEFLELSQALRYKIMHSMKSD